MNDARHSGKPRMLRQQWLDQSLVADKNKLKIRATFEGDGGTGHDNARPVVAAHGVERDPDRLWHRLWGSISAHAGFILHASLQSL